MIRWVKYSVLRHDEMRDRAAAMKRFVKAGRPQECLTRRNYNSMAAIARALDWKSKPMSDFPRTLGILSKKTRASFEQIVQLVDPDDDYNAYRGAKSSSAGNHIPWFSKTPQDPLPTQVEGTRQQRHIAHLRNQFTDNIFDDEAENQRRRKLKIKEDEDYRNRRPELKALGFA
ncbi:hypothetical protein DFH09DRAFT_1084405 [Mycena vulgaris]|nr:hypothetical protein DFH09DRAFT_1084405 [Mycena vulgaris]